MTRIVEVRGLVKHYPQRGSVPGRRRGVVHAVCDVSFDLDAGRTLGVVGESGSGKSTVARCLLGLESPDAGVVRFRGHDVAALNTPRLRHLRGQLQMVFQDPDASLDPRMTVGTIVAEPLRVHGFRGDLRARVGALLRLVGLEPEHAERSPHEFSGGQRQRIGIARALALDPAVLVLDEPVSALDVSIRAGVVNLLQDLQERLGLAYVFIAHDLSVVAHIADEVVIMYAGRIVEQGSGPQVFGSPTHPYTRALVSAVPVPDPVRERVRGRIVLAGDPADPACPPSGCRFRTRCEQAEARCAELPPPLRDGGHGHAVACHVVAAAGGGSTTPVSVSPRRPARPGGS